MMESVKHYSGSLKFISEELKNDVEIEWNTMGYFTLIKCFDIMFKFPESI
jgi:hypothetical protein